MKFVYSQSFLEPSATECANVNIFKVIAQQFLRENILQSSWVIMSR